MCISIPHPPPLRQIFFPGVKIFTVFSLIVFYKNIYPCSYEITGVYISQNIISLQPVKWDLSNIWLDRKCHRLWFFWILWVQSNDSKKLDFTHFLPFSIPKLYDQAIPIKDDFPEELAVGLLHGELARGVEVNNVHLLYQIWTLWFATRNILKMNGLIRWLKDSLSKRTDHKIPNQTKKYIDNFIFHNIDA